LREAQKKEELERKNLAQGGKENRRLIDGGESKSYARLGGGNWSKTWSIKKEFGVNCSRCTRDRTRLWALGGKKKPFDRKNRESVGIETLAVHKEHAP